MTDTHPKSAPAAPLNFSIDHPRLDEYDAESIRAFLRRYDQYCREVQARARQTAGSSTAEPVHPASLKFCVDAEFLEGKIALGLLGDVENYDSLTDAQLRSFLDGRSQETKEVVTPETLDSIVESDLRTNMKEKSAKTRMEDLFSSYYMILARNGLKWIISDNQSIAVRHVLSAIRPTTLRYRLQSDLSFSHHELAKDFPGFLKHAVRLAEAFQLVDSGRPKKPTKKDKSRPGGAETGKDGSDKRSHDHKTKKDKKEPICLWPPHQSKGIRHLLKDCTECPPDEKAELLKKRQEGLAQRKQRTEELARDGPSKSTRGRTGGSRIGPSVGRLQPPSPAPFRHSPSCTIQVSDRSASVEGTGRTDDGSDDSIASSAIAEKAVLKGIGRFAAIKPVSIKVALMSDDEPQSFTFSRQWHVPRLVLELAAGRMALQNISFLVADDDLSCEDILIGLPVLEHLGIDSRTLLERNRAILDGTDCASVNNPSVDSQLGVLGRLTLQREERQHGGLETDEPDPPGVDPQRPRQDYFALQQPDDPFPDPNLVEPEQHTPDQHLRDMIDRAKANGLPKPLWSGLDDLVKKHRDTFSLSFSSTPAKVPPLNIDLKPNAHAVRVKLRNYSASQKAFMSKITKTLLEHDIIYPNPSSKWACAPLIVPKKGPDEWRFTVDLRPVNFFTEPFAFPMPNIDEELTKTAKARFFAIVDFVHSYWQLMLAPQSQECQSFVTHENVWTPRRVLHGTTNAVLHLQSFITTHLRDDLKRQALLWVDDLMFHNKTEKGLLDNLADFFAFCDKWNIKLHPDKCVLFATEAKWCGRIISADGIRYNPSGIDGLTSMDAPSTGGQLQKFLCAMQWLRSSVPQFQHLVQPLHDFMEVVYARIGKRTKRAVALVSLADAGWTEEHAAAFNRCKQAIIDRITLAHRDESKRLCFYTDASDTHWSGIITQVPRPDLTLPHSEQRHEPLAFYSGRFSATECGWSTLEKEAYAVLASIERGHWLASCPDGFDLHTDHNNLIFIFDPLSLLPDIGQASIRKVLRWAVRLSAYRYVCFHIRGEANVWADLLGRWAIPLTIRRLVSIPPLPTTFADFDWPSAESIALSQQRFASKRPSTLTSNDGIWRPPAGTAWIPDDDAALQLRLVVVAHCGAAGHRGARATESALRAHFSWSTLSADVKLFVRKCIHCLSTTGGETIPRPFGPALHGTKPNALVQFDYISMGKAVTGDQYILMVRDDHSGYCWVFPSATLAAETAADALTDWSASFGVPEQIMSDGPTHFKNETLRLLVHQLRSTHHFTLPYTPWSNGAIERLGKELVRVARALLSELQWRHDEWAPLVPIFQSIINNTPSAQRGNIAPITAFTGRPATTPISTLLRSPQAKPITISALALERATNVQKLMQFMDDLRPDVQVSLQAERERMRHQRSRGSLPNFTEGDFVLAAREDFGEGQKLCLRWCGPRRITKALSDYVFAVEDLRTGEVQEMHGTRLKFYHDSSLNTDAIMSHVLSSETGMPVSRLMELADHNGQLKIRVRWRGLPESADTWEPLQQVYDDVPRLVRRLLNRRNITVSLRERAEAELSL